MAILNTQNKMGKGKNLIKNNLRNVNKFQNNIEMF